MAAIPVQPVGDGLAEVSFTSANAGGDTVAAGVEVGGWSLPVVLLVNNASAVTVNVTVGGLAPVPVAAGDMAAVQVNSGVYHGQPVGVSYSAAASVTVAALDLAR